MNHTTMEVPTLSPDFKYMANNHLILNGGNHLYRNVKINFPTKQLLAPIIVLIIWNMTTHLTFSLDHWLLATAQLIYMIRIGLQIANLMSDLKGRIAIAIAFQNIMLIVTTFIMIIGIHLITNESINELF